MKFQDVVEIARSTHVISTGLLLAGEVNPAAVRAQLSRWVRDGKLIRLRRGVYVVSPPWATPPHLFALANAIRPDSYVSCQSALAWRALIPEGVHSVVSVTGGRTETVTNPLGNFVFRHITPSLLWGWRDEEPGEGGQARIATPEKALLDQIYLTPQGDTPEYLEGLRLQNTDAFDLQRLRELARRWGKPKLLRGAKAATGIIEGEYL